MKIIFLFLFIINNLFSAYYCPHARIEIDGYLFKSEGKSSKYIYPYKEIEKDIEKGQVIKNIIDDRSYWDKYKNSEEYEYIDTGKNKVADKNNSKKFITKNIFQCIGVAFSTSDGIRGLFNIYNDIKDQKEFDEQLRNLKEALSKLTIEQKKSLNIAVATAYFSDKLVDVVKAIDEISHSTIENHRYEKFFKIYYSNIFPIYFEAKNYGREKTPHWKFYFRNDREILWDFSGPEKRRSSPTQEIRMIYKGEWWGPRHLMIDKNGKIFINKYLYSEQKNKKFAKVGWLFTTTFFFVSILLLLLNNSPTHNTTS